MPYTVWRSLAVALAYAAQTIKVKLAYRTEFVVNIVATLVWNGANLVFFDVVFSQVPDMRGWTFEQIVFLYGFGQFAFGIYSMAVFGLMWDFGSYYLVEGNLDRVLLRPFPVLGQMLLDHLYVFDSFVSLVGIAVAAWAAVRLGIPFTPGNLLAFTVLGVSAGLVLSGIALLATFVSFWLPNRYGLFRPLFTLNEYARYPLRIYPRWAQVLLTFVVPYGFACFYPASHFFADAGLRRVAWLTPAVAALTVGLAALALHRGIRRYESTGS